MKHKGQLIKKAFDQSGISLDAFCNKLGKSKNQIYRVFKAADVHTTYIDRTIEITGIDLYAYLTDKVEFAIDRLVAEEGNEDYLPSPFRERLENCQKELDHEKEKNLLLSRLNKSLEENIKTLKKDRQK